MFGIGLPELIVIMVVALLVVGPSKLPELAKTLGKAFSDFRRMADEVKETIEDEVMRSEPPQEAKPDDAAAREAYAGAGAQPQEDAQHAEKKSDEEKSKTTEGGTSRG